MTMVSFSTDLWVDGRLELRTEMTTGKLECLPDLVTEMSVVFHVAHINVDEVCCAKTIQ